jgi:hypothetical protein
MRGTCDRRSTRIGLGRCQYRPLPHCPRSPAGTAGGMNICVPTKFPGRENRARARRRRAPWPRGTPAAAPQRRRNDAGADLRTIARDPKACAMRCAALDADELGGVIACIGQPSRTSPTGTEQPPHHGARTGSVGHVGGGGEVETGWRPGGIADSVLRPVRDHVTIRPSQGCSAQHPEKRRPACAQNSR